MCGISGIVRFNADASLDNSLVRVMTDAQSHRGPDDYGYFSDPWAKLGHRRLKIIDLEGGRQPLYNEDESVVVIFNGEIYNYRDLTQQLVSRGHRFQTRSDTETIVHSYEEFGDSCVDHFRGMFAFAVWDRRRRRLLVARDRLGVKPLYYYRGKTFLAFASEIKSLLLIPDLQIEVDTVALEMFLSVGYVPGPRTMFRNIRKLPPGHTLSFDQEGLKISKYWDIEYRQSDPLSEKAYRTAFQELLDESVRLRLISDVPLGVFLSGGLDSTSILATMNKVLDGRRVKSFSVGYRLPPEEATHVNEFDYARLSARFLSAEYNELELTSKQFLDFIPTLLWFLEEPIAESSAIPLFFISKEARRQITVVLSGEGADEVFGGYEIYRKMLGLEKLFTRFPLGAAAANAVAPFCANEKIRDYAKQSSLPLEQRYRSVSRSFRPELRRQLLRQSQGSTELDSIFCAHFDRVKHASPLNRMLYVDAKTWLADSLLLKADKMTMANALELRVPFLDHKLVEFAAGLPDHQKVRWNNTKAILRNTMRHSVPQQVITRSKKGFPVPLSSWLRSEINGFIRESLLGRGSACRAYMDTTIIERVLEEHERGEVSRQQEIWSLLVFESWHKVFVERSIAKPAHALALA